MLTLGKVLVAGGLSIAAVGAILIAMSYFGLGRLPGDIAIEKDNFSFYFPLGTCVLLSLILSALSWLFWGSK